MGKTKIVNEQFHSLRPMKRHQGKALLVYLDTGSDRLANEAGGYKSPGGFYQFRERRDVKEFINSISASVMENGAMTYEQRLLRLSQMSRGEIPTAKVETGDEIRLDYQQLDAIKELNKATKVYAEGQVNFNLVKIVFQFEEGANIHDH